MNAMVPHAPTNAEVYRASTDAAGLCREIVLKTAQNIQGRKYVKVEGWQAIAIAHGCTASAEEVERVTDEGMSGFRAIGVVRRMSDGAEIARAEGFLGDDESVWSKRPVYARRAMVQTRAISRACRSAFAHVVVLIDANLSTTPAEEVPEGGFEDEPRHQPRNVTPRRNDPPPRPTVQVAAESAILMLDSVEACDKWKSDNEEMLQAIPEDDVYNAIVKAWKARRAAVAPAKTENRASQQQAREFNADALEGEFA